MICLEGKRPQCDPTTLQYVNTILNFIRPDFEKTCVNLTSSTTTTVQMPGEQSMLACGRQAQRCYSFMNMSQGPVIVGPGVVPDMTAVCSKITKAFDNYTLCLEELMPVCGQYLGQAILTMKMLQLRYSFVCSGTQNLDLVIQCVNDTMECYGDFNDTFVPALRYYDISEMCSSINNYSLCLNTVHPRAECQRFTHQAIQGVSSLRRQYALYCSADGGHAATKCVQDFQQCYSAFSVTFSPALSRGNMEAICNSLQSYSDCAQPLYAQCGQRMNQALQAVRILKEQFALRCDPEFQRLSACKPLASCLNSLPKSYFTKAFTTSSSIAICRNLGSYFPCVKKSLEQCNISPEDSMVDFAQLGPLSEAYCQNLLGNRVLNTCPEFVSCMSGIVLVNSPDPSAMFDADTWCSYMDMSLSCVDRAVNTKHCGLSSDDTIIGHLTQQRALKRKICKMASVPPISHHDDDNNVQGLSSHEGGSGATTSLSPTVVSFAAIVTIGYRVN